MMFVLGCWSEHTGGSDPVNSSLLISIITPHGEQIRLATTLAEQMWMKRRSCKINPLAANGSLHIRFSPARSCIQATCTALTQQSPLCVLSYKRATYSVCWQGNESVTAFLYDTGFIDAASGRWHAKQGYCKYWGLNRNISWLDSLFGWWYAAINVFAARMTEEAGLNISYTVTISRVEAVRSRRPASQFYCN